MSFQYPSFIVLFKVCGVVWCQIHVENLMLKAKIRTNRNDI